VVLKAEIYYLRVKTTVRLGYPQKTLDKMMFKTIDGADGTDGEKCSGFRSAFAGIISSIRVISVISGYNPQ
jgi:hypothetical protein